MSLLQELGVAGGFIKNKVWRLASLDNPQNKFIGQFQAEGLTERVRASLLETQSVNLQQPAIHWQSGDTEILAFRARIFRTSSISGVAFDAIANPLGTAFSLAAGNRGPIIDNGSVRDQIEKLKKLSRKNNVIGRPERFLFTYGTELEFEVFIKSVGNITYDDIRSDGTIRGASFEVQMTKVRADNELDRAGISLSSAIKLTGGIVTGVIGNGFSNITSPFRASLINIPGASLHTIDKVLRAKQGDTYEKIAAREYGNPLLGDVLRRAQPDKADLNEGDEFVTIKRQEIVQIEVTPQSIPFKDLSENKQLLRQFLELRGRPTALVI